MPGKLYAPGRLDVLVGTTVTWQNVDRSTHTVTEDDDVFDSGHIRPGDSFSRDFPKSGTFRFHCTIHRFMRGDAERLRGRSAGPAEPLPAGRRARLAGVAPAGGGDGSSSSASHRALEPSSGGRRPVRTGRSRSLVRAPEPRRYRVQRGLAPRARSSASGSRRASRSRDARPVSPFTPPRHGRGVACSSRSTTVSSLRSSPWRAAVSTRVRARLSSTGRPVPQHVRAVVVGRDGWSDGESRPLVVGSR